MSKYKYMALIAALVVSFASTIAVAAYDHKQEDTMADCDIRTDNPHGSTTNEVVVKARTSCSSQHDYIEHEQFLYEEIAGWWTFVDDYFKHQNLTDALNTQIRDAPCREGDFRGITYHHSKKNFTLYYGGTSKIIGVTCP